MGTNEYLSKLNLDQLKHARDYASKLIAEKEAAPKRVVWFVEDNFLRLKAFSDTDYLKAAEYLLEMARAIDASRENISSADKELHLARILVPESEYHEYGV